MTEKIRLLVVDDHPVVRVGLRMLLAAQPDMEVVGEAVDGHTAVERALELKPDVVVMDLAMREGMDGLAATREIVSRLPQTRIVVLTMHSDEEYLRQALQAGATGYVLKEAVDTEIAVAIRVVQRGEVFLYPSFTRVLLGDLVQSGEDDRAEEDGYELLSKREKDVLRLVALGDTNREIAERLFLSVRTVETYRARLMEKLNLKSRGELVRYALRKGLRTDEVGDPSTNI